MQRLGAAAERQRDDLGGDPEQSTQSRDALVARSAPRRRPRTLRGRAHSTRRNRSARSSRRPCGPRCTPTAAPLDRGDRGGRHQPDRDEDQDDEQQACTPPTRYSVTHDTSAPGTATRWPRPASAEAGVMSGSAPGATGIDSGHRRVHTTVGSTAWVSPRRLCRSCTSMGTTAPSRSSALKARRVQCKPRSQAPPEAKVPAALDGCVSQLVSHFHALPNPPPRTSPARRLRQRDPDRHDNGFRRPASRATTPVTSSAKRCSATPGRERRGRCKLRRRLAQAQ